MNIGDRLRELREARRLSQADIEHRTGLLRCYVSRVECGHTIPSLDTLEKWAHALELEVYQLFFTGEERPEAPKAGQDMHLGGEEKTLIGLFRDVNPADRRLLLQLARKMSDLNARTH